MRSAICCILLGVGISGCGSIPPSEFRARVGAAMTVSAKSTPQDFAACVIPYMEGLEFFITNEGLTANMRKNRDGWEVFAMNADRTMYLIDVSSKRSDISIAALFLDPTKYNAKTILDGFTKAAKGCGAV
jgi:hypothetical protein